MLALASTCRVQLQRRKSGAHFSPALDFDRIMKHWNSSPLQGSLLFRFCDICSPTPTIHFLWRKEYGLFFDQSPTHLKLVWTFFLTLNSCCSDVVKTNKSPNLPQRKKAMTTAEGQRAGSDGLWRPLLAQPFYESNLNSLKDKAETLDTSQYLMNKNYWKM